VPLTARKAGLDRLYHYQKFHPEHLSHLLLNQRVRCSDPTTLNDPWDCRPWFDPDAMDDPEVTEQFIQYIFAITPTETVSEEEVAATPQGSPQIRPVGVTKNPAS
jgi:hypothetical protein